MLGLFNKYSPLASSCGEELGEGSRSTSTLGSALIAASSTEGNLKKNILLSDSRIYNHLYE